MNEHMDESNQPPRIGHGLRASGWKSFPCTLLLSQDVRFRVHTAQSPIAKSGWAWINGENPKKEVMTTGGTRLSKHTELDTDTELDTVGHRRGCASHRHGRADTHWGNTS